ncbi:hypothetical protein [Virgisporangium aurantiacum]|uniref:Rho termination factor N-terminal domain-containing protein n=1 Tax=Virgisporangium aurantiacum TaxID=175570 RepID=A0A8J3ZAS4_9ACTN|nr:hypothetical protein [Virgisporangium aurantiacum]GIJ58281.1 hypothetical protein Vau01_057970 [Virgisporangium aurantiacum]
MTNPVDRTHAVLLRVSEFLRTLPADQLDDLIAGTAKLQVVAKGSRPAARRPAAKPLSVTPEKVRDELVAIGDTVGAERYVDDLKLTVVQLRALAKELGISVPGKAVKGEVIRQIVQWTVGRRLTSETISRPAPARF